MGDEGAAVYNCLLCDSYALLILGILPDRKLARGTKGQSAYEDALEEFQLARAAEKKLLLLACPTCNALAHKYETDQVAQGEFLRQGMAVLTPCVLVPFEDGQPPPVYRDENARGSRDGKPRWRLCQGVGPAGLELDRTRTRRLHKPSLRPFGIDVSPMELPEDVEMPEAVHRACAYAEAVIATAEDDSEALEEMMRWRATASEHHEHAGKQGGVRPVLECWPAAMAAIELGTTGERMRRYDEAIRSRAFQEMADFGI